jgi:Fur family iron response transcriptional regulator
MHEVTNVAEKLRGAGLRPTRQRLALARLLFAACDRHVSAEALHAEVLGTRAKVSLATVYNTLRQFKEAGLLREIAVEGERSYYDTNTSNHFHFLDEETGELSDIDPQAITILGLPEAPPHRQIASVDVIVRLHRR